MGFPIPANMYTSVSPSNILSLQLWHPHRLKHSHRNLQAMLQSGTVAHQPAARRYSDRRVWQHSLRRVSLERHRVGRASRPHGSGSGPGQQGAPGLLGA